MLDAFFATDHYKLIINTFILIFNSSRAFGGPLRVRLFADFLLGRWFLPLFCHWSFNVRLAFHHLLLFRTTILRRSHLNWARYDADEVKTIDRGHEAGIDVEDADRSGSPV